MEQLANTSLLNCLNEIDLSHNKNIDDSTVKNFYRTISASIQKQQYKNKVITYNFKY